MTAAINLQTLRHQLAVIVGENSVFAAPIPTEYTRDFGNQVRKIPRLVVVTRCETEVAGTVRLLTTLGIPFRLRGKGHSSGGHTLISEGVVIHNVAEPDSLQQLSADQIQVPARCTWAAVCRQLHRKGVTIPVLTNHLDTTVGGTLSAGGYGIRSVSQGAQVDHVASIRVIHDDGSVTTYSPEHPLFRYILTGMGQIGIIESVVMRVEPFFAYTKLFQFRLQTLTDVADLVANLLPEAFQAITVAWAEFDGSDTWLTIGTQHADRFSTMLAPLPPAFSSLKPTQTTLQPTYSLYVDALPERMTSQSVHCWSDFGMAAHLLNDYLTFLSETILPACKSILNRVYILPISPNPVGLSFGFDLREPGSQSMTFGVGVYLTATTEEESQLALQVRAQLLRYMQVHGGRPYLPGFPDASRADLHPAYASSIQACRHHYPEAEKAFGNHEL